MQDPTYQLPDAEGIPNGEVGAMDLRQLQKEKQDLEQQLLEKNKVRLLFTSAVYISALSQSLGPKPSQSLLRVLLMPLGTSWGRYELSSKVLLPAFPLLFSSCIVVFLSHSTRLLPCPPLEIMSRVLQLEQ